MSPSERGKWFSPQTSIDWAGPFRVLEVSQNSALVTRIGENTKPLRIQSDMLGVVPNSISDERIDTVTNEKGANP